MVEMMETSNRWCFESHKSFRSSLWLQSTIADLDRRMKAMLKLFEEDADSFAQRAEMYYKRRPELISMVEDFYRAHRSLAERYDKVNSDSGLGSPVPPIKPKCGKLVSGTSQTCDSCSESCGAEEDAKSEVEDPEQEDSEAHVSSEDKEMRHLIQGEEVQAYEVIKESWSCGLENDQVKELREEIEKLKDQNKTQKALLMQKDEEKREAIRQLSVPIQMLKDENMVLKKWIPKYSTEKQNQAFEFKKKKTMERLLGKLFNKYPKSQATVVAL